MIKINLAKKELLNGDCLEVMRSLPDNSVDSVVTDPPYGLNFMGKKWDYDVPSSEIFQEILRVLKPGGHMLCACGTRTQHRMAVNIEDAGFEIRDVITWLYGSGFPKSMDISKAIDKQAGAEREIVGQKEVCGGIHRGTMNDDGWAGNTQQITAPATESAKQWQGWGTALKPACEFWTLARKPLSEKTVAANVLEHGTGGINVDGCRVESGERSLMIRTETKVAAKSMSGISTGATASGEMTTQGRWPANLILDEEAAKVLDKQSIAGGIHSAGKKSNGKKMLVQDFGVGDNTKRERLNNVRFEDGENIGASRFFYVAKASKSERNQGCDQLPDSILARSNGAKSGNNDENPEYNEEAKSGYDKIMSMKNNHPTVKPIKLMTYLVRLITPPNGVCMDPFMGSGSTGVAAVKEGFGFIGIEREPAYFEICKARIESA